MLLPLCLVISNNLNKFHYFPLILDYFHYLNYEYLKKLYNFKILRRDIFQSCSVFFGILEVFITFLKKNKLLCLYLAAGSL